MGVFALALLAAAGFGVKKSMMSSDAGLSDLALANVEALAQENGEGGNSGGAYTVNCPLPSERYGNCRYLHVIEGLYGACMFECRISADPNSSCFWFWENLTNFCSALGGV